MRSPRNGESRKNSTGAAYWAGSPVPEAPLGKNAAQDLPRRAPRTPACRVVIKGWMTALTATRQVAIPEADACPNPLRSALKVFLFMCQKTVVSDRCWLQVGPDTRFHRPNPSRSLQRESDAADLASDQPEEPSWRCHLNGQRVTVADHRRRTGPFHPRRQTAEGLGRLQDETGRPGWPRQDDLAAR